MSDPGQPSAVLTSSERQASISSLPGTGSPPLPRWPIYLVVLSFAALWIDLIRQLSYVWRTDEQYAYGLFVPFLGLGLLVRKWPTRPAPEWTKGPRGQQTKGPLMGIVVAAAILLIPIRIIHEINQDWPLISWSLTLGVVGISLYALYLTGGLAWVRHFAFPICFILVAVKWPYRIENPLTQSLMRIVAAISVELLDWFNIPALQRGNLIELSTGVLGVDEACSGIRSLQSTVMAALLMGELYGFKWPLRLLFLAAGVTLAFLLNVVRALFLAWQAGTAGTDAISKWHDSAGVTIVFICFACLWLMGWLIQSKMDRGTTGLRDDLPQTFPLPAPRFAFRSSFCYALFAWTAFMLVGNGVWYSVRATDWATVSRWSVKLPKDAPGFEKIVLPPRSREILKADLEAAGRWDTGDGSAWTVYFLRWVPKSMQSVIRARGHRPDVCLRASNCREVSKSGLVYLEAGPLNLPFHRYVYETRGQLLFVFFSLWEDGDEQQRGIRSLDWLDRLTWAAKGRKHRGQQTLELILTGYKNMEEAEEQVRERLARLIQVESVSPNAALKKDK